MGTDPEADARAPIFLPFKSTLQATFRTTMFSLIGAMLGAMILAFIETLIGALGGAVVSWLLRKWKVSDIVPLGGAFCGGVVGALGLAFYRDKDIAVLWGLHGAWIGGLSVCVLVVLLYGLMILTGRMQRKEATT
jgi:hypothetical protein